MEKDRITGIICKGTKIRLNGICFLSYLLFQIPHRSTLQFYLNLSFCQLFISLDIAANVDIILKCHWFWKLKTRAKNCQRDFVFLIIQAEISMSILDCPFLKRSSNPTIRDSDYLLTYYPWEKFSSSSSSSFSSSSFSSSSSSFSGTKKKRSGWEKID